MTKRLLLLGLALAACARRDAPPAAADSSRAPAPLAVLAPPGGSFDLRLPERWRGHFVVDSLSTAERGRALPGSIVFLYQPSDTTLRFEALLVVAVYDSSAWRAVRAEGGPPPGDSVAVSAGRVYVLALPQSNPFAAGTPDAIMFDLLKLQPREVASILQPR